MAAGKMTAGKLTAKQELFAREYVGSARFNGYRAALAAGCPPAGAKTQASAWLNEPRFGHVRAEVERLKADAAKDAGGVRQAALEELTKIGFARHLRAVAKIEQALSEGGIATLADELDDADQAAIGSITISRFQDDGITVTIKPSNKVTALQTILKYFGQVEHHTDDDEQSAAAVDQWLDDVERRLEAPLEEPVDDDLADEPE